MNKDDVINLLHRRVKEAGGLPAFCAKHRINRQNTDATMRGVLPPYAALLTALGIRRVVIEKYIQAGDEFAMPKGYTFTTMRGGRSGGRPKLVKLVTRCTPT